MAVPASYNDLVDPGLRDHVGEVWYQRTVRVPRGWAGERVVLYFESATHRATVWVGDQEVVESIFTIGCYMMMARLTEATETDLDPAAGMAVFDGGKKRTA